MRVHIQARVSDELLSELRSTVVYINTHGGGIVTLNDLCVRGLELVLKEERERWGVTKFPRPYGFTSLRRKFRKGKGAKGAARKDNQSVDSGE